MLLIALGMACSEPTADGEAFTLNIDVQLAPNQSALLDELTGLELVVEYATGSETFPLSTTEPGRSAEITGIDALDAETVALIGYRDGEVAAFGRSAALSVSERTLDATLTLLRTNDFAWLDVPGPIGFAAAASTGDGAFWVSGGSDANSVLNNDNGTGTVDTVWGLSLTDGVELALSEVDAALPSLADEDNNQGVITVAGRLGHTMSRLSTGTLLIAGGEVAPATGTGNSLEAYQWSPPGSAPQPLATMKRGRAEHRAEVLSSGDVVLVGGYGFTGEPNLLQFNGSYDFYDSTSGAFQPVMDLQTAGAIGVSTAALGSQGVLACGGFIGGGSGLEIVSGCDLIGLSGAVEAAAALPVGVAFAEMTSLDGGRILLTGGITMAAGSSVDLNGDDRFSGSRKVYLYEDGDWTDVSVMNNGRARHAAAALPDGRVLVAGGTTAFTNVIDFEDATALACAELYEPDADRWTEIGSSCDEDSAAGALPAAAWAPAVAADPDYGVLLVGGISGDRPASGAALFVGEPDL